MTLPHPPVQIVTPAVGPTSVGQAKPSARRSRLLAALALGTALAAGPLMPALAEPAPIQAQVSLPSFAPIVDRVMPAVVNISVVEKADTPTGDDEDDQAAPDAGPGRQGGGAPFDEFMRRFFEQQGPNGGTPFAFPHGKQTALGSGFIIDPSGYVVTNNHVAGNADTMTVIFQDGSQHKAKLIGKDAKTDLALLKIDAPKPLPYLDWGDSNQSKVGDWVLAVGNPFGLGGTVTAGIVSARSRSLGDSSYVDYLQIDAPVNRGNSGGPTFDLSGHVIGINTAIYSPNGGSVGIAFSIPSNTAKQVIDQLKATGTVARGYLGVEVQEVTPSLASALGLDANQPKGALVASVTDDGPAKTAGVETGDLIQKFDGRTVQDMKALPRLVADTPSGKNVDLEVLRHGKPLDLHVTIQKLGDEQTASASGDGEHGKPAALGVALASLTDDVRQRLSLADGTTGVLISRVAQDSPAANAGLQAGDIIQQVNGVSVSKPDQARDQIASARSASKPVLLLVNRHGTTQFVAVQPTDGQG